jgi:hypothetical protein
MSQLQFEEPIMQDVADEDVVSERVCACGEPAQYSCGEYWTCENCAWALAEEGGAP